MKAREDSMGLTGAIIQRMLVCKGGVLVDKGIALLQRWQTFGEAVLLTACVHSLHLCVSL